MINLAEDVRELFLDAQVFVIETVWAKWSDWVARRYLLNGWPDRCGDVYHATSDGYVITPIKPIQDRYEKQRKGLR